MAAPYSTDGAGPTSDFQFDPNMQIDFSILDGLDDFMTTTGDNSVNPTDTVNTPMAIPQDMNTLFPSATTSQTPSMAGVESTSVAPPMPYYSQPAAPPMMPAMVPPPIPGFAGPFWDPRTSGWTFMPLTAPAPAPLPPFPQPKNTKRKQTSNSSSLSEDSDDEPLQRKRKLSKHKRSRAARRPKSPSPVNEEDIFSSEDEPAPKKAGGRNSFKRKRKYSTNKKPSVAQTCVCGSAKTKIPRPRNMFILWRTQNLKKIQQQLGSASQTRASKVAGEQWKALSDDGPNGKKHYAHLAKLEAENHARMYPDYKFMPNSKTGGLEDNKFGTASCTCGAYVANVRKSRAAGVELDPKVPDADRPAPVQTQAPAPSANMMPYPVYQPQSTAPIPPVNAFGLALPGQRRSSRNHLQSVLPTTETIDVDAEMVDADAHPKRRPSAIFTLTDSPPAMNTRSRSISQEPETQPLPTDDLNGWLAEGEPNWDDLFGDDAGAAAPGEDGTDKSPRNLSSESRSSSRLSPRRSRRLSRE